MRAMKSSGRGVSREARLADKLRENLKRRKGKERARRDDARGDAGERGADDASRRSGQSEDA